MTVFQNKKAKLLQFFTLIIVVAMLLSALFFLPQRLRSQTGVLSLLIIILGMIFVVGWYFWRRMTIRTKVKIAWLLFICGVALQIILILTLSTGSTWDPQVTLNSLVRRYVYKDKSIPFHTMTYNYLSYCPNNLFLFYFYAGLQKMALWLHVTLSWTFINWFNALAIDVSVLIFYATGKKILPKNQSLLLFILLTLTFIWSPWVVITYTDTLSLLTTSLALWLLILLLRTKSSWRYLEAISMGLVIAIGYYLKASSVIFAVAACLISLIMVMFKSPKRWRNVGLLATACVSFGLFFGLFGQINKTQKLYPINTSLKHPSTYYMMLGSQGVGDWNQRDFARMLATKGQNNKRKLSIDVYTQRVKKMNWRYLPFLARKFYYTVQDGSWGWGRNSNANGFLLQTRPQKRTIGGYLRSLFYPLGRHVSIFYVVAQCWWILLLVLALPSCWQQLKRQPNLLQSGLNLTILGSILYLLLFESGMSRYLIQFLPFYLTVIVQPSFRLDNQSSGLSTDNDAK
ncbi:glycosyltransferase family 39 protein [Bombilactobacillus folatiphilus]|uniref:Glycosyltransferase family 39 protein n=1 Tax=Bombilactobacillus folatiphilus TaxID=2923362 RepID=A0ABY4P7D6_9LACO|nr:glycosyltransferase family 39 protein [Bombilactobacillus folatiphilus]UQS81548.1 glycosyltransferase family 39 protein [Bombilactobacillus folatiphilus]